MRKIMPRFRWFLQLTIVLAMLVSVAPISAYAVNPDEVLSDPVLEQRARKLSVNLRCLVCQNQSIDDSDASLARDLRVLLRQRLVAGDSDDDVISYIVSRYGEFVLLQPRFSLQTVILWSMPIGLLLIGLILGVLKFRKMQVAETNRLTEYENDKIMKILGESD